MLSACRNRELKFDIRERLIKINVNVNIKESML